MAIALLPGKHVGLAGVRIDSRGVIDHQPTSIGRRSISAVQVMFHNSQQSRLLADAPLPENETRVGFMQCYARDSALRLAALATKTDEWWEGETSFFEDRRTRLWVITRRLTHTSHHRSDLCLHAHQRAPQSLPYTLAMTAHTRSACPRMIPSQKEHLRVSRRMLWRIPPLP